MLYTARFAHLESAPDFKSGDVIRRGNILGVMGNTGKSTGPHLHLDVVCGARGAHYSQRDIESGDPAPAPQRQGLLFIDDELFGVALLVTTGYADPDYFFVYGKVHMGYDVVPHDRKVAREHFAIHWNRSAPGRVTDVEWDPEGYGHCLYVAYEVA